jgi:hypothetical protein
VERVTLDQLFGSLRIQMFNLTENDAGTKHICLLCQGSMDKESFYESSPHLHVELELFLLLRDFHLILPEWVGCLVNLNCNNLKLCLILVKLLYTQVEHITLHQLFGRLHIQMIDLTENDAGTKHINLFCQSTKDKRSL